MYSRLVIDIPEMFTADVHVYMDLSLVSVHRKGGRAIESLGTRLTWTSAKVYMYMYSPLHSGIW